MSKNEKISVVNFLKYSKWQEGQALLIVVLVMVVAMSVGLSIAVRTTTNIRTASEDESSQRAFSAAEAGIEQSLTRGNSFQINGSFGNTTYSTKGIPLSGAQFLVHNGTTVLKDEPVDVWLSDYPDYITPWSGNLTVNWGTAGETCAISESVNTQAALEIVLIYGSKAAPRVHEYLLDPCSSRRGNNKFQVSAPGGNVSNKSFAYQYSIAVNSGLIARIIPLYAPTSIGISANSPLPSQGTIIASTGVFDNTKREIVSFRGYPKLPLEVFPFIFFSPK